MDRRFMALRVVATIFKIFAWLFLIVSLLAAIGALVFGFLFSSQSGFPGLDVGGPLAGIAAFIVLLIVGILNFLLLYAGGEFVYLFLSVEENSRRVAYFAQQQYMSPQTPYSPPPAPADYED
jgi:hypothetical protein